MNVLTIAIASTGYLTPFASNFKEVVLHHSPLCDSAILRTRFDYIRTFFYFITFIQFNTSISEHNRRCLTWYRSVVISTLLLWFVFAHLIVKRNNGCWQVWPIIHAVVWNSLKASGPILTNQSITGNYFRWNQASNVFGIPVGNLKQTYFALSLFGLKWSDS